MDHVRWNVRRALLGLGASLGAMLASLAPAAQNPAASVVFLPIDAQVVSATGPTSSSTDVETAPPPDLRLANALVIGGGVAGVAAYGFAKWWDQGFKGHFTTGNEGWFGQDTRYGGADKLGHAYSANAGVRLTSALLQSYGNAPDTAANLAFWSTFGTLTAVEVADGFSKQYTFSWQDATMNAVGAGFGWWCEKDPAVDALLDYRLMYQRSQQATSWDLAGDYSGQTYLLVAKASGIPKVRDVPVLRYLEVALGYGTRNYDGPPGAQPSRYVYYGLQINLSALLDDTVFGNGRWPAARRASEVFLDLWQVQNTGVYARSRL
jgi:hypothetical protein